MNINVKAQIMVVIKRAYIIPVVAATFIHIAAVDSYLHLDYNNVV